MRIDGEHDPHEQVIARDERVRLRPDNAVAAVGEDLGVNRGVASVIRPGHEVLFGDVRVSRQAPEGLDIKP
jgi:hypothetical protein